MVSPLIYREPVGIPSGGRFAAVTPDEDLVTLTVPARTLVADARGSLVSVRPGVIDEDARYVYANGQCMALAAELSRATGWPMILRTQATDDGSNPYLVHAYALAPEGFLVDIDGADDTAADDFEDEDLIVSIPAGEVDAALAQYSDTLAAQDQDLARSFVTPVLDRYWLISAD